MKRVGIIGWPLGHSLSPAMHNAAFRALGMDDWQYDLLPIPPDQLQSHIRTLRDEGGYLGHQRNHTAEGSRLALRGARRGGGSGGRGEYH